MTYEIKEEMTFEIKEEMTFEIKEETLLDVLSSMRGGIAGMKITGTRCEESGAL